MSTNIYVCGERVVTVKATGKEDTQTKGVRCWQTPSDITEQIMHADDPKKEYTDWIRSVSRDIKEPIDDDGDIFSDKETTDFVIVNYGEEHIKRFNMECSELEDAGYTIMYDSM